MFSFFYIKLISKIYLWFSRPWLIFFLYMVPTICTVIAVFYFALPRQKKYFQFSDGAWVIESLYFEVSKLIWAFFTLLMTVARLKSSFFCMVWVLFPSIGNLDIYNGDFDLVLRNIILKNFAEFCLTFDNYQ